MTGITGSSYQRQWQAIADLEAGVPARDVARAFGVSATTLYCWKARLLGLNPLIRARAAATTKAS